MTGDKLCSIQSIWHTKHFYDVYNHNILKYKRNANCRQWRKITFYSHHILFPITSNILPDILVSHFFVGKSALSVEEQKAYHHVAV